MKHTFSDGKYTVEFNEQTGTMEALRNNQPWQDLTGNKLVLAMLQDYDAQRQLLARAQMLLNHAEGFLSGFLDDDTQEEPIDDLHEAIVKHLTDSPHMPEVATLKL